MNAFLKPSGSITMEFPLLLNLVEGNQFDTIYHEHFSYLSFTTVRDIFRYHGLNVYDVEKLSTHGGSIRIYASHMENVDVQITDRVHNLLEEEEDAGQRQLQYYSCFKQKVEETKRGILEFLVKAKNDNKTIVGYGAPGKGNTLLNFCGVRTDFLDYTVDRNPHKQGRYLPGTHIPIYHPDKIRSTKPDYILILPWNLSSEIVHQMSYVKEWGSSVCEANSENGAYKWSGNTLN